MSTDENAERAIKMVERVQTARRPFPEALLKARAFAVGPQGAAQDLRRIVGCRLRSPREGSPAPATSAAPRAAPRFRNRRRQGSCWKDAGDSGLETGSLIGASLAREAA
jgi:hypothetical protein